MKNLIYILGPNKDENEKFIGRNFSEEYKSRPDMFVCSTEKLTVDNDAICTYIVYCGDNDWLYSYSNQKVILVKEF